VEKPDLNVPLDTTYVLSVCILCLISYCIYVVLLSAQWGGPNGTEAWSLGLFFLQCFDTVGWVFWPIKPVPDMTYNVFGGTLNLAQPCSTQPISWLVLRQIQSAPIKNTPLEKIHDLSYCNRFFHQIYSFHRGGFRSHMQQILLEYLL